jgi:hypothetical protein
MYTESLTTFSTAQALTVTAASTSIYDVTGAGAGNAPAMIGGRGVNTAIGFDVGLGEGEQPWVYINIGVTGTSSNTISFALQSAPDNGSYSAGTYTTIFQSNAFVATTLTAGMTIAFPVPPLPPTLTQTPRFYRLDYICSAALTLTVSAGMTIGVPTGLSVVRISNNLSA